MNACQRIEADTNETIARLNRINFVLMVDGVYRAVNDKSLKQQAIIDELGLNTSYFKYIAEDVNCRLNNPIHSQIRRLPDESEQLSKRGKSKKSETKKSEKASDGNTSKLSRCPKNSKIKNQSSEKQTEQSSLGVKRGPGRPKGSKNKPKNRP